MIDYAIDRALGGHLRATASGEYIYRCPKCGDTSGHLYVNYRKNSFICHKCSSTRGRDLNVLCIMLGISKKFVPIIDISLDSIRSRMTPTEEKDPAKKVSVLPLGFRSLLSHKESSAYTYLRDRGISDEEIEFYNVGLCEGDCFTRIYFPDFNDGVVDFWTSRSYIASDKSPKYLFSEGVSKSTHIYSAYRAISAGDTLYVAEGPLSAIALGYSGVATFGKDFSSEQVNLLVRSGKKLVVVYDSDAQGNTLKLCKVLRSKGTTPDYILLPNLGMKKADPLTLRCSGDLQRVLTENRKTFTDEDDLRHRLSSRRI